MRSAGKVALFAVVWALVACGGDSTGPAGPDAAVPDLPDADPDTPCPLTVQFSIRPDVPGLDPDTGNDIEEVRFELSDFRLISDTTGGAGAPETTVSSVDLAWSSDSSPSSFCLMQAPAGRYQEAQFQVGRYLVKGDFALPDGNAFIVDVEPDNLQGSYGIQPSVVLDVGGSVTLTVEVDVRDLLRAVDSLKSGSEIEINEESDPMVLADLRDAVEEALEGED